MAESCQVCGVIIDSKPTGRPPRYCEPCFKKMRREYQRQKYQSRTHVKTPKVPSSMSTEKGTRSDLKLLSRYEHTEAFKELQNYENRDPLSIGWGGSGYNAPLQGSDHSLYSCRLKLAKSKNVILKFKLDFTRSACRQLTEPINGTDQWCWYLFEFNRQLRERRMRVSVEKKP